MENNTSTHTNGLTDLTHWDTGTTTSFNEWGSPVKIDVIENQDNIELIYKEISNITYTSFPAPFPAPSPEERVFKIVYGCKDGKWNKSEPIYGIIIQPSDEDYEFN